MKKDQMFQIVAKININQKNMVKTNNLAIRPNGLFCFVFVCLGLGLYGVQIPVVNI